VARAAIGPPVTGTAPIRIAALYQFARFDDLPARRAALAALCDALGVKGTLLLAQEGINARLRARPMRSKAC